MLNIDDQQYVPLRDVVFNTLRQAIIKGELKPGEKLLEIKLADMLGVSRTPIREAMRKLEQEGLVIMTPRHGVTVSGITRKHLQDVLEIRLALERLAIELACERMNAEQLKMLRGLHKEIKERKDSEDAHELSDIDEKFHEQIYNSTNNPRLIQMLENLREQMYRYRLVYMQDMDKRSRLITEHNRIVKALETHDAESGKNAISEHIKNQEQSILSKIEK